MTDTERESRAMMANDIRVLVGQLNEAVRKAAGKGLRVEIVSREVVELPSVHKYAELQVRILAEVQ